MKYTTATVLASGLFALAAPVTTAAAGSPSHRVVTAPYLTPGGVQGVNSGDTVVQGNTLGSVTVHPRATERHVTLSLTDRTGLPVAAEAYEDLNGDGKGDVLVGAFCGRTTKPLRLLHPGSAVIVYLNVGQCPGAVSTPTTGTVSATFLR